MSRAERAVAVTRPGDTTRRELRNGRGTMVDVVTPAHGSALDLHVNEIGVTAGPGPYHLHTRSENVFVVLDGDVELRIDGEDHRLGAGDSAFIPPGVPHSVSPVGDRPVRILEIYAPADPDFVIAPQGGAPA